MEYYSSERKECLTLSQAIVKYLQVQFSEYDGKQQRFIQGIWGIFGHGNVSGLSQALVEYGQEFPYHKPTNEQSMVHATTGNDGLYDIHRSRSNQYDYRGLQLPRFVEYLCCSFPLITIHPAMVELFYLINQLLLIQNLHFSRKKTVDHTYQIILCVNYSPYGSF